MESEPMPPIDRAVPLSDPAPEPSTLSRIAYPLAMVCSLLAAAMAFALTLIGFMFQGYGGEAAAPEVDYDGIGTFATLGAFVLIVVGAALLRRLPAAASCGLAAVALVTPAVAMLSRDNVAGFVVGAWVLPAAFLVVAAIWGFAYRHFRRASS